MVKIEPFFDERTSTLSYVVWDEAERVGVVIDSVLDFEPASGRTWTESADEVSRFLEQEQLEVPFVLDTHAHADHLSGMTIFAERFGAKTVIGAGITRVQEVFRDLFGLGEAFPCDGRQFDLLLTHGERLPVGAFELEARHTPGHTPACMSYRVEDALFVGDALFQPDYGTARCDFPGGSAEALYASIHSLYEDLPGTTRVFTCHDYQPEGRPLEFESTIEQQRDSNVQLSADTTREDFVRLRETRDASLDVPALMLAAIQVNIRAGGLPEPEANGISYLRIPLNAL